MANILQRIGQALSQRSTMMSGLPLTNGRTVELRSQSPTEYSPTGKTVRQLAFKQHPIAGACIRVITEFVSAIPLQVYMKRAGQVTVLPTHPLQKLLDNPSFARSSKQLRAAFATDFLIYGNALWRIAKRNDAGQPSELRRVNPEGVQIVYVDSEGDIVSWSITDHFGRVQDYLPEDIIHFKDIDATAPDQPDVFGYPRAAAALNSIASDKEASDYVRQIVNNDGTPTLAVILQSDMSEEDASMLQNRWHELNVLRGRRGRAAFMNGVQDIKPIGFNLQNLEFPDLRRINREDICSAFGVDPRIIGAGSASNDSSLSGAQYVEARARLVQHTIEPMLSTVEDMLNLWLAPEFGNVHIRFDKDALRDLIEDDQATSTRVINEFNAGLRSFQECRSALRLSPTPAGEELFLVKNELLPASKMEEVYEARFTENEKEKAPAADARPRDIDDKTPRPDD